MFMSLRLLKRLKLTLCLAAVYTVDLKQIVFLPNEICFFALDRLNANLLRRVHLFAPVIKAKALSDNIFTL